MPVYVSFLRGINVSGQKPVNMKALKSMYENMDFQHVITYLQSGNVVFKSVSSNVESLGEEISQNIKNSFGYEVFVHVMPLDGLKKVIDNNPFTQDSDKDPAYFHVTLLKNYHTAISPEILRGKLSGNEDAEIAGGHVYLYCPDGYGQTKLTNTYFERVCKTNATTRNWRTINELMNLAVSVSEQGERSHDKPPVEI